MSFLKKKILYMKVASTRVRNCWNSGYEHCIVWNDTSIAINWPIQDELLISSKDLERFGFKNSEIFS